MGEKNNRWKWGGWWWERIKREGHRNIILRICIIWILKNRLQPTCVALIMFREVRRTEGEVKVGRLRNSKATNKHEVTGEMVKGGGVGWI